MAVKMTKRGQLDNVTTNEFICDTAADLAAIDPKYINLGSVAIVLQGSSGLEVYMANSKKEWINLGSSGGGSGNSDSTTNKQESNIVGEGTADHMIIHDDTNEAASDEVDKGQADSMVLSA